MIVIKLNQNFIIKEIAGENVMISVGENSFDGMIKCNDTAYFVVQCLQEDTTKDKIVDEMEIKFGQPRDVILKDVDYVLKTLYEVGAIDD